MKNEEAIWVSVQRFLGKEARALDEKRWDDWLALYDAQAEYWLPAMGDDGGLTEDPKREVSLIYYESRAGLEDRVFRIRTGKSSASTPEVRTLHMFSLHGVEPAEGSLVWAKAGWTTHSFRDDQILVYRGWSEYLLEEVGEGGWLIKKKKTVVMDPVADTLMDFYNV